VAQKVSSANSGIAFDEDIDDEDLTDQQQQRPLIAHANDNYPGPHVPQLPAGLRLDHLQVPDSDENMVQFMGTLQLTTPHDLPPDYSVCCAAIKNLRNRRRRDKFRKGVGKMLKLRVSCRRAVIIGAAVSEGHNFQRSLLNMICTGTLEQFACVITGYKLDNGEMECEAHVFECQDASVANYYCNEVLKASRVVLDKVRHFRATANRRTAGTAIVLSGEDDEEDEITNNNNAKLRPRKPDASDLLLYASANFLDKAVRDGMAEMAVNATCWSGVIPKKIKRRPKKKQQGIHEAVGEAVDEAVDEAVSETPAAPTEDLNAGSTQSQQQQQQSQSVNRDAVVLNLFDDTLLTVESTSATAGAANANAIPAELKV